MLLYDLCVSARFIRPMLCLVVVQLEEALSEAALSALSQYLARIVATVQKVCVRVCGAVSCGVPPSHSVLLCPVHCALFSVFVFACRPFACSALTVPPLELFLLSCSGKCCACSCLCSTAAMWSASVSARHTHTHTLTRTHTHLLPHLHNQQQEHQTQTQHRHRHRWLRCSPLHSRSAKPKNRFSRPRLRSRKSTLVFSCSDFLCCNCVSCVLSSSVQFHRCFWSCIALLLAVLSTITPFSIVRLLFLLMF